MAAAILDIQICEMLLADGVRRAQTRNCTKFRQNRSVRCRDIAIFWIFKMAADAILDFWNGKILLVIVVQREETHQYATPNFVKIGQSVAKMLRFFDFSRWRPPPSWNLECIDALLYQILSKSVVPLRRYCDFSNFQHGRHRSLGFLKTWNFIHYWSPELRDASACQILSKSVNRLQR